MAQTSLQAKLRKIAKLASKLERHVYIPDDRTWGPSEKDQALRKLVDEVKTLSPEVRELLEMDE